MKAALIQAGKTALTPVLARLFTAVFRSGRFPPEWALGAITPVFKKGDTADPNNYRGITVGHVLGKLYALAINARLTSWLETRGLRAHGQSGFQWSMVTTRIRSQRGSYTHFGGGQCGKHE